MNPFYPLTEKVHGYSYQPGVRLSVLPDKWTLVGYRNLNIQNLSCGSSLALFVWSTQRLTSSGSVLMSLRRQGFGSESRPTYWGSWGSTKGSLGTGWVAYLLHHGGSVFSIVILVDICMLFTVLFLK